jgi:hypothetical protein
MSTRARVDRGRAMVVCANHPLERITGRRAHQVSPEGSLVIFSMESLAREQQAADRLLGSDHQRRGRLRHRRCGRYRSCAGATAVVAACSVTPVLLWRRGRNRSSCIPQLADHATTSAGATIRAHLIRRLASVDEV